MPSAVSESSPSIFISYRRDDAQLSSRGLHSMLLDRYGRESVFMDHDSLQPGQSFPARLQRAVEQADVVLCLIGPRWIETLEERIPEEDFVVHELSLALDRADAAVIPVLLGGAEMPARDALPDPLKPLARRLAVEVSDERPTVDCGRLCHAIDRAQNDSVRIPLFGGQGGDDDAIEDRLRRRIRPDLPFGPSEADGIADPAIRRQFFEEANRNLAVARDRKPVLILGRRGSGKTSLLHEPSLVDTDIAVDLNSSNAFASMIRAARELRDTNFSLMVDESALLWRSTLEHALLDAVARRRLAGTMDAELDALRTYVYAEQRTRPTQESLIHWFHGAIVENATSGPKAASVEALLHGVERGGVRFTTARSALENLLVPLRKKPIVLIDSLEDFTRRDPDARFGLAEGTNEFGLALVGLFRLLGEHQAAARAWGIRMCIPVEVWPELSGYCVNPAKDLSSTLTIHWHGKELIRIAEARLRLFLSLHHPDLLESLDDNPPSAGKRRSTPRLLRSFLPEVISHAWGGEESTTAYLLRHTQLLPRQVLRLLNELGARVNFEREVGVPPEAVISVVKQASGPLADEITSAYAGAFADLASACRIAVAELPFVFGHGLLQRTFVRHVKGRAGAANFEEFRRMLIRAGVVGRVIREGERYIVGEFDYTLPRELNIGHDDALCLHPLFAERYFSPSLAQPDAKPVYPFGSDVDQDDWRIWS